MSKFHFRLTTLLKLRENERQQRQAELAQALEAERIVQNEIDELAVEIVSAKSQIRGLSASGEIPVDTLLELQRYSLQLRLQSAMASEKLSRVRAESERRRAILTEANRQVRILEKLREKQAAAFEFEQLKREQKLFDEIAQRSSPVALREAG